MTDHLKTKTAATLLVVFPIRSRDRPPMTSSFVVRVKSPLSQVGLGSSVDSEVGYGRSARWSLSRSPRAPESTTPKSGSRRVGTGSRTFCWNDPSHGPQSPGLIGMYLKTTQEIIQRMLSGAVTSRGIVALAKRWVPVLLTDVQRHMIRS